MGGFFKGLWEGRAHWWSWILQTHGLALFLEEAGLDSLIPTQNSLILSRLPLFQVAKDKLMKSTQEISPRRALLHPVWLGALALLVVNDHILKDSVLAGVVTGKLSDVAGLFFVPVLVAAILNIKTKRGLYGCAVLVGTIFSAINLSPVAAELWNQIMGIFFFGFVTTVDWTDLFALVMIPIGLRVLMPAMEVKVGEGEESMSRRRRLATLTAALVGGLACLGTSIDEPRPEKAALPDYQAQVSLANMTRELTEIRVYPLRGQVHIDCDAIEAAPGDLLSPLLYADEYHSYWRVGSAQQYGIGEVDGGPSLYGERGSNPWPSEQECQAMLVSADLPVNDVMVFWRDGLPMRSFEVEPGWNEGDSVEGPSMVLRADYSDTPEGDLKPWGESVCTYHEGEQWYCDQYGQFNEAAQGARYYWEAGERGPEFSAARDEEDMGSCWLPGRSPQQEWGELADWDGEWVIDGVERDGRCGTYQLADAESGVTGESIRLCGLARLHEVLETVGQRGDSLRFSTEVLERQYRQLEIEFTSADEAEEESLPGRLIQYQGYGLPEEVEATARFEAGEACAPAFDSCANTWIDGSLHFDGSDPLRVGESTQVGTGQTIWLAGASHHAVVVRDCVQDSSWPELPEAPSIYVEALVEIE